MGSLFSPKMPAVPQLVMPEPAQVPSAEDEARKRQEEADMRQREINRKGRRSTILTGTGLTDIPDENIKKTTLLGG